MMNTIVPIIFGVGLAFCGVYCVILLVQEYKDTITRKKKKVKKEKDDIIATLKWFRDEYVSPKQVSSIEPDLDTPARKLLCTICIDFLEEGKNAEIIEKYKETFFRLITQSKLLKDKE